MFLTATQVSMQSLLYVAKKGAHTHTHTHTHPSVTFHLCSLSKAALNHVSDPLTL